MTVRLLVGDCRERLRELEAGSVHTCVTSPPYFGLRDYGVDGQIGLEETPDAFVAELVDVFREVRRVLRDDGTCWINLGDSYNSGGTYRPDAPSNRGGSKQSTSAGSVARVMPRIDSLKHKDLIGIPWRAAFALQQPYYTGVVADERDRVWLAAMLDAEGCITASEYETGGRQKSNIYVSITNASVPIIDKCERLFPQTVRHVYEKGGIVNRTVFRWDVERMEQKALFIREVYPHLVAKRKQAIVGYTFLELQRGLPSKKKGYLPEQLEQRSWLVQALSRLNKGEDVDLPNWLVEPPSLFEPGFYLRQDLIWAKPNPMPESVTDRCTKSHEYLFLLAKSPRYYYNAEAIAEAAVYGENRATYAGGTERLREANVCTGGLQPSDRGLERPKTDTRNRRSVWSVATQPFKEAHFATYPPELIEPCILAGCPKGGTVLDPFGGAGTTGLVADRLQRDAVLIELNPDYAAIARNRLYGDGGMFAQVAAE